MNGINEKVKDCDGCSLADVDCSKEACPDDYKNNPDHPVNPVKFSRPEVLAGQTPKIKMGCGNFYITINNKFDEPIEIFCKVGKAGGCQAALLQGVGRLASIALQNGVSPERISKTLSEISCPGAVPGEPGQNPSSCLDALARILAAD